MCHLKTDLENYLKMGLIKCVQELHRENGIKLQGEIKYLN